MTNNSLRFYSSADVPKFLKCNQFIRSGYRVNYTKTQCIKSVFMITNETGNIWTHLFGTFLFFYFIGQINSHLLLYEEATIQDHVIVTLFCMSFICCLLTSSIFHIFNCQSKHTYEYCLRMDLVGISISFCGTYLPPLFYGFYCFPFWRTFYTGSSFIVIVVNIVKQACSNRVYTEKVDHRRIALFVSMVLFGIIPTCHWVVLMGGLSHPLVQRFIPQIIVMYTLAGTALFFYLSQIPERFLPGYCDYLGHSHQFWHIFIMSCFIWWYVCSLDLLEYQIQNPHTC